MPIFGAIMLVSLPRILAGALVTISLALPPPGEKENVSRKRDVHP